MAEDKSNSIRKSAIAKVTLEEGSGNIIINGKSLEEYTQNNPKCEFYK